MKNLNKKASAGLLFLVLAMAALLFVPAWTLNYWQAWAFLAVFGGSGLAITIYLMKNDPKLLERRTQGGPISEKEMSQKIIQSITAIAFVAILVVSESYNDRTLRFGASPNVYGSFFLSRGHAPLARLLVGAARDCLDDACANMATLRRGEIPGEQSSGLFGVSEQGDVSVGAVHLVIAPGHGGAEFLRYAPKVGCLWVGACADCPRW
jgi:hypothetical protein